MAGAISGVQTIPILDLAAQYRSIRSEVLNAVQNVCDGQHFILGENVSALEREVAEYCGVEHGVGVASGTDALMLALKAAGVGPGDEVIVPGFSFIATADVVSLLGAVPVFADVQSHTLNIDTSLIEPLINERTKAIVPVHLYGQTADMATISAIAESRGLAVVEDCAQALGARCALGNAAGMGTMGCISFFPSKNLGGCGDGGMIVTKDGALADRLRMLRSHGSRRKYHSEVQGWNSRLDELQAAILRVKLPHLEEWTRQRQENAEYYRALLGNIHGVTLLEVAAGCVPVYHQFTIRVRNRDAVQAFLSKAGVQTFVYYPVPLHLQTMYAHLGYGVGDLPIAEAAAMEVLSIPMYPELSRSQIEYVSESIGEAIAASSN